MAKLFAQHADAGHYHLETRFVGANNWEWMAIEKKSKTVKYSGEAQSLEGAKKAVAASIGRKDATCTWMNIGPAIESPE